MIAPLIIILKSKKTTRVLRSHSRNSFFQPDDPEKIYLNLKLRSIRCIRWTNVITFEEASRSGSPRWLKNKNKKKKGKRFVR